MPGVVFVALGSSVETAAGRDENKQRRRDQVADDVEAEEQLVRRSQRATELT